MSDENTNAAYIVMSSAELERQTWHSQLSAATAKAAALANGKRESFTILVSVARFVPNTTVTAYQLTPVDREEPTA